MTEPKKTKRAVLATTVAAVVAASTLGSLPAPAGAQQSSAVKPSNTVSLSVGAGRMVRLDGQMTDLFVANDKVADVQVRSSEQIYIFGKAAGETTVYATDKGGKVLYSANVRVGNNVGTVDELIRLAMPDAQIRATPMNGAVLLTGTVAAPADVEEAGRIVSAYLGEGTQVISRLKTATPLQVMLQVKIAEVSRSLLKDVGVNLTSYDMSGGDILFSIGRGRDAGSVTPDDVTVKRPAGTTTLGLLANVLGVDILGTLDLNDNNGRVVTLAEPTLTALSGETASFLAGGEFPIATTSGINGTQVEFKEYGVSLAFTPVVLEGGRISMRVRPEVSELTSAGSIKLNGIEIPGLSTRRAETTVELGSGQSFMIGGLLSNSGNNSVEKTPFLGDLPILGALFRSQSFRRNETELVIVVTPYLVKPVSASQIALPTDGFRNSNDAQRLLLDKQHSSRSGEQRPMPTLAPARTAQPGVGAVGAVSQVQPPRPAAPAAVPRQEPVATRSRQTASAAPGFSF
jgi:pilus assembly protein CpaC